MFRCSYIILRERIKALPEDGVAAATPPNQLQRCILTDYFNNYNFIMLK